MKTLKFKKYQFCTDDARTLCLELEAELGVNLMNKDSNNPNEVQGFMNTSSGGDVEVFLYEKEDIDAINALPETNTEEVEVVKNGKKVKEQRTYKIKENVPRKKCNLTDAVISQKCTNFFETAKGFTKHYDMKGKDILKKDIFGREK